MKTLRSVIGGYLQTCVKGLRNSVNSRICNLGTTTCPRKTEWLTWATHQEQEVSALSGQGDQLAQVLASPSFGYLSEKDKALLTDAVELQCEAFIMLDQKLTRNAAHLENYVPIRVLEPTAYWQSLRPWARMLH